MVVVFRTQASRMEPVLSARKEKDEDVSVPNYVVQGHTFTSYDTGLSLHFC